MNANTTHLSGWNRHNGPAPLHHKHRGLLWLTVIALLLEQLSFTAPYAQSISLSGTHAAAAAHLNFKVVVPQQITIRVVNTAAANEPARSHVSAQANDVFAVQARFDNGRSERRIPPFHAATPLPDLLACGQTTGQTSANCLLALP
ncbi:MAG: hypothetical protein P8Y64_03210 [Gammaproteobacteria bacterium]|jgi:hypothetical protein